MGRKTAIGAALFLFLAAQGCLFNYTADDLNLSNAVLQARVEQALQSHPELHIKGLGVEASDRDVMINGIVDSWQTKEKVSKIVGKIRGVRTLMNDLLVQD